MASQEVGIVVKALQFIAVVLFTVYFLYQCYDIYFHQDRWVSSFYSSYGAFESWWNKNFKRTLMKEFQYTMPDQKELYPQKRRAAIVLGYTWSFGSLLLWTGEKWSALILLIPHFVYTMIINGPTQAKTMTTFGRMDQAWILDFAIFAALLMITGSKLSISSGAGKKAAVEAKRAF